eukprot:CAMPEP_0117863844 /NCGR_PEP_ID=MMETSP0950-20121206/5825_1 /TAXON_ID=44440 /ORGANISM="Chattonella subsalsa, Strain CCMP2191" /LENGTH=62 /DNA_ID=CAMNT_0005714695 /DNA_START=577 /DNA_END=764 /DNA_ORIENTATION=+
MTYWRKKSSLEWADDETVNEFSPEHVPENVLQELKSTCKPLITWLEEADEEDSDGEDDEEES